MEPSAPKPRRRRISASRKKAEAQKQTALRFHPRGGARPGAGRPRNRPGRVPHVARPSHSRHHPLHVTLRLVRGVPNLRGSRVFRAVRAALAKASDRFGFRLVHYSVQNNHVHLIAEAADRRALTRGMQGLSIRLARRVNASASRSGRLFAERYHARTLRTPLEVRRALLYVLRNERRHLAESGLSLPPWQFDACSSAATFDGFLPLPELGIPPPERLVVTVVPVCFLLRRGWRRHGLIALDEVPRGSR